MGPQAAGMPSFARSDHLTQELDALEENAGRFTVPLSYASELYALRNNINLVRRRLRDVHPHVTHSGSTSEVREPSAPS